MHQIDRQEARIKVSYCLEMFGGNFLWNKFPKVQDKILWGEDLILAI